MSEENKVPKDAPATTVEKAEREDMVEFLRSSGKFSADLAGSLYDQGLNSWQMLIEGTGPTFRAFKGIGPAKATALMELGKRKKEELEASRPGLKEVLGSVPRMNQRIISSLLENGYESIESFNGRTEKDLQVINGIGPRMSEAIMKAINDHVERYPTTGPDLPEAEEAVAEVVAETPEGPKKDEKSLVQRIIDAIGTFFGGKNKEEVPDTHPVEEPPKEEPAAEQPPVPEIEEIEPEMEKKTEEAPADEVHPEGNVEEEAAAESASTHPPEVEEREQVSVEAAAAAPATEKPPEKRGFFERIKEMVFGPPKKEEPTTAKQPSGEDRPKEGGETDAGEEPPSTPKEIPEEFPPVEEAPSAEKTIYSEFWEIPGVSRKIADELHKAGYQSIDELREAVPEDLVMVRGIGQKTAEKICKALRG